MKILNKEWRYWIKNEDIDIDRSDNMSDNMSVFFFKIKSWK